MRILEVAYGILMLLLVLLGVAVVVAPVLLASATGNPLWALGLFVTIPAAVMVIDEWM